MMGHRRMALLHPARALLPELGVYTRYFRGKGWQLDAFNVQEAPNLRDYQVEWRFMGVDVNPWPCRRVLVHEYISASVPPWGTWKDKVKRYLNRVPDGYVFGDPQVAARFGFTDQIPTNFRPAGIDSSFFRVSRKDPEYTGVYVGAMDRVRGIHEVIDWLLRSLPTGGRLLLVGDPPLELWKTLRHREQVTFTGKVNHREVPDLLASAVYGLNLIPNIAPFNAQPSLKLLEYCAAGLQVISTDIGWARAFERQRKGRFYYLPPMGAPLDWNTIRHFPFRTPRVEDLNWEVLMETSKLAEWLDVLCIRKQV